MHFPDFFEQSPAVHVYDPLAELLGAPADGLIDYQYADAVKLAGHSCPTVAGAFLTGRAALASLYPDTPAERGGVRVTLPAPESLGTTGVTAQVLTLLTGAAADNGFKGLGGRFARNGLLDFAEPGDPAAPVRFQRLDTNAAVSVMFDPSPVPLEPYLHELLMAVMQNRAGDADLAEFGTTWQARVCTLLLERADDPAVVRVMAQTAAPATA